MTFEYLENLKFDILKNHKSFRGEIKNIFPCFPILSFKHTKHTSKNLGIQNTLVKM